MKRHALLLICLLLLVGVGAAAAQTETVYIETARIGRGRVYELFWSPDGTTLAASTARGIWFYQANNLTIPPRLLEINNRPALGESSPEVFYYNYPIVAFSEDWSLVAIKPRQGVLTLYDVATGSVISRIPRSRNQPFPTFTFSPDGRTLAVMDSSTPEFEISFYETVTGGLLRTFTDTEVVSPTLMRYSPDGRYLAILPRFYLFDTETFEIVYDNTIRNPQPLPELNIPSVVIGATTRVPLLEFEASTTPFSLRYVEEQNAFALSGDGSRYLTSAGATVQIKDVATDEMILEFPSSLFEFIPSIMTFDPQNERIAYVDSRGNIIIARTTPPDENYPPGYDCPWNNNYCMTSTNAHAVIFPELETITNNSGTLLTAEQYISPNGRWIVKLDWQPDNIIRITRAEDGEVFQLRVGYTPSTYVEAGVRHRYRPSIRAARVSPDGHWLALAFTNFCPDGNPNNLNRVFTEGCGDRVVRIYDVSGDQPIAEPVAVLPHDGALLTLAFSADSQTLASSNRYNQVFLWRAPQWEQIAELIHTSRVGAMTFTETGELITLNDGILHIWSPQ